MPLYCVISNFEKFLLKFSELQVFSRKVSCVKNRTLKQFDHIKYFFKGNPNFQGILDWIPQILHYYCRKQHKNVKNSQIIEQNFVLFLPFSLFTETCSSCHLLWWQSFSISWTQYSVYFKRHTWSFVLHIVSFSGLKMIFSKIS